MNVGSPITTSKSSHWNSKEHLIAGSLLTLAIIAVYFPNVNSQFAGWDDVRFVNLVWKPSWGKAWSIISDFKLRHGTELYYNPLHLLSLMLDQALVVGNEPTAWISKLTNLVFHVLNTFLLYHLLVMLFGSRLPCFIGALVFGLHPLQVSTVAWIAERKNLLACFFYLGSLISFIWYLRSRSSRILVITAVLFLCSLLSKPTAVTLPVILLTLVILERGFTGLRNSYLVFFLSLMLCGSLAWGLFVVSTEQTYSWLLPPIIYRPLLASGILAFYISKFIVPVGLLAVYPKWNIFSHLPFFAGLLIVFAILAIAIFRYHRRIDNRILWAIAFIMINLSLTAGLIPFAFMGHSYVADHFMYLPMIGVSVLTAGLLQYLTNKYSIRTGAGETIVIAIYVCVGVLAGLSLHQTMLWSNPTTVWKSTLKANPESYAANNNYGVILMEQKKYDEAVQHFTKAIKIAPMLDMPYLNLGAIAALQGDREKALKYYAQAARINPGDSSAFAMQGKLLRQMGRNRESITLLEDAIKKRPGFSELRYELGIDYYAAGLEDKAEEQYAKAIADAPYLPGPYYQLGAILLSRGQVDKSIRLLERALKFTDNAATRNVLGAAYAQKGDFHRALQEFVKAYKLQRDFEGLRDNLANALMDNDRGKDAERFCEDSAKLGKPCSDETLARIRDGS